MQNYTLKSTVEAVLCTNSNFENVYSWAAESNAASDKTDTTFKLTVSDGNWITISNSMDAWIIKCGDNWLAANTVYFDSLFASING